MKKTLFNTLALFSFAAFTVEAQPATTPSQAKQHDAAQKDKIMLRDQIDDTDIYAIPFDDSEVEDEEEINRAEKKEVFPLPHSR
ncbi:MAG: hypothetical protein LW832_00120 [Parachlamydia sp.]|jgi:hypothetical protein|nr:hypothetical protein [Parachlamydia sp.]